MKFIYGEEGFLVNQELNRAIREHDVDPIIYSNDEHLDIIIQDSLTKSMFSLEPKLIVVKNHYIFSDDKGVDELIKILESNIDVNFIFVSEGKTIKKSNKLIKFLLDKAQIYEFKALSEKEMVPTIKKVVDSKGGTIDNNATIALSTKLPTDLRIIVNEIEKLLLESEHITYDMVEKSISHYLKNDYFALSNAITSNDAHGIISSYRHKQEANEEPTIIIGQIASTLSLAHTVFSYKQQGLSNKDISEKMNIHIFRVKKASDIASHTNINKIKELLKSLAKIDLEIKTGIIDPEDGIETYLLQLIK